MGPDSGSSEKNGLAPFFGWRALRRSGRLKGQRLPARIGPVLELDPRRLPAGAIGSIEALADDALVIVLDACAAELTVSSDWRDHARVIVLRRVDARRNREGAHLVGAML